MGPRPGLVLLLSLLLAGGAFCALPPDASAWGNGSSTSVEWTYFGIHDITTDIALRTATYLSPEEVSWLNDWYVRNETDYAYSFDPASTGPTDTDNVNAYTDDPDSHIQDWDNHTYYLHPRSGWDPPEGDAARRVQDLYNLTRDHLYVWLMKGSVRWDTDQHLAAYYGGLMAHYVMDITQFGHTDWTRLDHNHPVDDPSYATYHGYYESRTWTDKALNYLHQELMSNPLPEPERVPDAGQAVRDLAAFVNGRHGPDVQFLDADSNTVTLGSTYVRMLTNFTTNWDANVSYNDARGYNEELWDLTLENLLAGMDNLTALWASAYLDAKDMFMRDAPDLVLGNIYLDPVDGTYEGDTVTIGYGVWNNGTQHTGLFNITIFVDDEVVVERGYMLRADEVKYFLNEWTAVRGTHDIRIVIDSLQVLSETNETNNIWNVTYEVVKDVFGTKLMATPQVYYIPQETVGSIDLRLGNIGSQPETYTFLIDAEPGVIDFSLTILEDTVTVPAFDSQIIRLNYTTRFSNPTGMREFRVVAVGGNSSANVTLTFIITKREAAPYIVVDYHDFTNVSVPITFNASGSWDPNGDIVSFYWDFGDTRTGTGAIVHHLYWEEGVYVINLTVSDGTLERHQTLEVSVEDALPPSPGFTEIETDLAAIRLWWTPWDSKYWKAYHIYLTTDLRDGPSTPEKLMQLEYLVMSIIGTSYANNFTIEFPTWVPDARVMLVIENIYGHREWSDVSYVDVDVMYNYYPPMDVLSRRWVSIEDFTKHEIELRWREWAPVIPGGYYSVWVEKQLGGGPFTEANWSIHDLRENNLTVTGLDADCQYVVRMSYVKTGYRSTPTQLVWTLPNERPIVIDLDDVTGFASAPVEFTVAFEDQDGWIVEVDVAWGDGQEDTYPIDGLFVTINHTYSEAGSYNIWVTVVDDDLNQTSTGLIADIEEAWPSGFSPSFWMVLGIFVAFALLVLVVMMATTRRRGPQRHAKALRPISEADDTDIDGDDGAGGGGPPSGDG